ncbi:hypothetical protein RIF29_21238 [Crotalaria pallida]|uniref:Uncharacterized protein n=1 Tax=Crotalaria pallida TaxID=3830 RepID=A0AAN9I5S3_CROPI
MAKKRGRPSKHSPSTLSSSTPKHVSTPKQDANSIDFSLIHDRILNFDGLDGLNSNQANNILQNIDAIKEKVVKRMTVDPSDAEVVRENQLNLKEQSNSVGVPEEAAKKPSIWESFDITKLRNAGGKLEFHQPSVKEGTSIDVQILQKAEVGKGIPASSE